MKLEMAYNNSGVEHITALSHLINNVWEYVMTKLIIANFVHIKPNTKSKTHRCLVYGVGINDADYIVRPWSNGKSVICPFYKVWASMIGRCYDGKRHKKNPTYRKCSVVSEWRSFMSFRSWMVTQQWQGLELDKDILTPGNKVYSPETCVFVTHAINGLVIDQVSQRGKYPQGVSFDKERGKFNAQASINGKNRFLGRFSSACEAFNIASKVKAANMISVAETQLEPIRSGLLRHAEIILNECTNFNNANAIAAPSAAETKLNRNGKLSCADQT